MEADFRTISHHMCQILDRIDLSPDLRETTVNCARTCDVLASLPWHLLGYPQYIHILGSTCEATITKGLGSDIDQLYCNCNISVVNDVHGPDIYCLLMVRDSHTAPGYCKLQLVRNGAPLTADMLPGGLLHELDHEHDFDMYGRIVRNQHVETERIYHERNGPACTDGVQDYVDAYKCTTWPECADEWLTRTRPHNWPSTDQIQTILTLGCFVVPVGHPHSDEQSLEWRISFSLPERELVLSFNETQHKCYVLLKITKKDMITSQLEDSISTYHCKTIILYAIENTPAELWVPENLLYCFLHCLNELYRCVVNGVCPSYVIPQANLFDRRIHGELQAQVAALLERMLKENGEFLYRIVCDDIGVQLKARLDKPVIKRECVPMKYALSAFVMKLEMYRKVATLLRFSMNRLIRMIPGDTTTPCVTALEDLLSRLASFTSATGYTGDQTREAVQLLVPLLHTSLASHLAARLLQLSPANTEVRNICRQLDKHIKLANASGNVSCLLKTATLHYVLGEYKTCERTLSNINTVLKLRPLVFNDCGCRIHRPVVVDNFKPILHMFTHACVHTSCFDVVNKLTSYCVSYTPPEMDATPTALQYELYKSEKLDHYPDHNWSNVDFMVLLNFMKYLVYDQMGNVQQSRLAVQMLSDILTNDARMAATSNDWTVNTLHHRETAYNLLGWIHKREGHLDMAAHCFMESIHLEPVHNAAKWHIADLYLRLHQTREAVQLLVPPLHTSLASHLAARLLQLSPANTEVRNIRRRLDEHIHLANASGNVSCLLKSATLHYMLGEYTTCDRTLCNIDNVLELRPLVFNMCGCRRDVGELTFTPALHTSCLDVVNNLTSHCVSYTPPGIDATPTTLQYELFKSQPTRSIDLISDPPEDRFPPWYRWSNVDFMVLLHFMKYQMGNVQQSRLAVETLADLLTNDSRIATTSNEKTVNTLHHRETAYNLLGWIYKREGHFDMAAHCFVESIRLEPVHNAAKWHIADLYLRVHQATAQRGIVVTDQYRERTAIVCCRNLQ